MIEISLFIINLFFFNFFFMIRDFSSIPIKISYFNAINILFLIKVVTCTYLAVIYMLQNFIKVFLRKTQYDFEFFSLTFFILLFIFLLVLSKSVLSFFFFLEVITYYIFYLLIIMNNTDREYTNKLDFKNYFQTQNNIIMFSSTLNKLFSILFFQFWINFFSCIMFFISLIFYSYIFGSSNFYFLKCVNQCIENKPINVNSMSMINYYYGTQNFYLNYHLLLNFFFFFSFFLKNSFPPFHFYKIEIYSSLLLCFIPIYLLFTLIAYFILFFYCISIYLKLSSYFLFILLFIFLFYSVVVVVGNLFSYKSIKEFLALSTIVNNLSLFFVVCFCFLY